MFQGGGTGDTKGAAAQAEADAEAAAATATESATEVSQLRREIGELRQKCAHQEGLVGRGGAG